MGRDYFNKLWDEYFSMRPPLDKMSDFRKRDELKEFAREIFDKGFKSGFNQNKTTYYNYDD